MTIFNRVAILEDNRSRGHVRPNPRDGRARSAVPRRAGPGMEWQHASVALVFGLIANYRALVYCGNVVAIESGTAPGGPNRPLFLSRGNDRLAAALGRAIARGPSAAAPQLRGNGRKATG